MYFLECCMRSGVCALDVTFRQAKGIRQAAAGLDRLILRDDERQVRCMDFSLLTLLSAVVSASLLLFTIQQLFWRYFTFYCCTCLPSLFYSTQ